MTFEPCGEKQEVVKVTAGASARPAASESGGMTASTRVIVHKNYTHTHRYTHIVEEWEAQMWCVCVLECICAYVMCVLCVYVCVCVMEEARE